MFQTFDFDVNVIMSIDFLKNSERAFSLFLSGIFKIFISSEQRLCGPARTAGGPAGRPAVGLVGQIMIMIHDEQPIEPIKHS